MQARSINLVRKAYVWFLRSIVIVAVGWFVSHHIDELSQHEFTINWFYVWMSFFPTVLAYLIMLYLWYRISMAMGFGAPIIQVGRSWFLSMLGKYVPSNMMVLLVRFETYNGIPKRKIMVASGMEYAASLAAASIIVLVAVCSESHLVPAYVRWSAIMGTGFFLFLLYPPVLEMLLKVGFRVFRMDSAIKIPPYRQTLSYVGGYLFEGLLQGMGLFLVLRSMDPVQWSSYLLVVGTYQAAGLIGMAAFFAPGGIGVREGVLLVVLSTFISAPVVIVGAIIIRLINTVTELLMAGLFVFLDNIYYSDKNKVNITSKL